MRKRGLSLIFALAPLAATAQPDGCTLNPYDPQVAARLSADARALELRKGSAACLIALDCTVRAAPVRLDYELATLAKGKIAPYASQMTRISFEFADGTKQTCNSTGARVSE